MKDPAFLFYPGDYLRDTQMLSEKSQVAYDRMMCESKRSLVIDLIQFKFLTKKMNQDEKDELVNVLEKVDGGYQITWVAESIQKREKYINSRRKNLNSKSIKKQPQQPAPAAEPAQDPEAHQTDEVSPDQIPEHQASQMSRFQEVIDHLNQAADLMYPMDYPTSQLMRALVEDGYTAGQMIDVIDLKIRQTQVKEKGQPIFQRKWLSPHTLFKSNLFPKYANEVRDINKGHTAAPAKGAAENIQEFAEHLESMGL